MRRSQVSVGALLLLASARAGAEPPAAEPAPAPAPAAVPAPAPQAIEEVVVTGKRTDPKTPTEHRLSRDEMRVVPGAFGDPFRAIDILPSLVPIISGLPYYYIRGAPPSAVGYYVDEVRVPYLFHFGLGPGVVQPALIEEVAVHPAAYPARYGRYSGGIVSGTTREPASELYGEGNIRIYDAGAYLEAPIADGRATIGVGGRYSYTAGLLSLLVPNLTIDYRDYNARFSYALDDRWRLSAVALGAYDFASTRESSTSLTTGQTTTTEQVVFASEFHRLDLRADRRGADGATTRIAATVGLDRTRLEDARFAQDALFGLRARHRFPATRRVDVELGADLLADHYAGDIPNRYAVTRENYDQAVALFAPRTETAAGAWVSATYKPAPGWDLTGTLRGDVFTSEGKVGVGPSPRVSMRVPLAPVVPRVSFLAALGVAPQPPAFAIPIPAVGYRGLPGGLSFAYQKSAGAEVRLPWRFTFKAIGFHHSYFNLRDFARDRNKIDFQNPQVEPTSPTQAYGVELSLMRKLSERFAAYSSGTILRAELGSTQSEKAQVSPFDRSFVAQIGGVADLGRHWTVSSRFLGYGGWPAQAPGTGRAPPFFRLDVRIEKRWVWREHRYIAFVIEGLNVTASTDKIRNCDAAGQCRDTGFGPIIVPSVGVEGAL